MSNVDFASPSVSTRRAETAYRRSWFMHLMHGTQGTTPGTGSHPNRPRSR